jgi:hypothetical protein
MSNSTAYPWKPKHFEIIMELLAYDIVNVIKLKDPVEQSAACGFLAMLGEMANSFADNLLDKHLNDKDKEDLIQEARNVLVERLPKIMEIASTRTIEVSTEQEVLEKPVAKKNINAD